MAELATPNYPDTKTDNVGDQLTAAEFNEIVDGIRALYNALGSIDDGSVETVAEVLDALNNGGGSSLLYGDGAPTGFVGTNESFYVDTTNKVLYGPKSEGSTPAWPNSINIDADGVAGRVLSGEVAPDAEDGEVGDFYLNTSSEELFGPKYIDQTSVTHGRLTTISNDNSPQTNSTVFGIRGKTTTTGSVASLAFMFRTNAIGNYLVVGDKLNYAILDGDTETLIAETGFQTVTQVDSDFQQISFSSPVALDANKEYIFAWSTRTSGDVSNVLSNTGGGSNGAGWDGTFLTDSTYTSEESLSGTDAGSWSFNGTSYNLYFGAFKVILDGGSETWPVAPVDLLLGSHRGDIDTNTSNIATNTTSIGNIQTDLVSYTKVLTGAATPNDNQGTLGDLYIATDQELLLGPKAQDPETVLTYGRNINASNTAAQASNQPLWGLGFQVTSDFDLGGFGFMLREGTGTGASLADGTQEWKVYLLNAARDTIIAESDFSQDFDDTDNASYPYFNGTFSTPIGVTSGTNYYAAIYVRDSSTLTPITTLDLMGSASPYTGLVTTSTVTPRVFGTSTDNPLDSSPPTTYSTEYGALRVYTAGSEVWGDPVYFAPHHSAMKVVQHGSDPNYQRPSNYLAVYWIGATPPSNAQNADQWYDTTGD